MGPYILLTSTTLYRVKAATVGVGRLQYILLTSTTLHRVKAATVGVGRLQYILLTSTTLYRVKAATVGVWADYSTYYLLVLLYTG